MSRRNNKKKKKDFFPKPAPAAPATPPPVDPPKLTPEKQPTPSAPERVVETVGYREQGVAAAPSEIQRAANQVAASMYAAGVDPISKASRAAVDDTIAPREAIVEVERKLLTYFEASFNSGSLKPSEAAQLGRSLASIVSTRRKIELAESEEKRRQESHPKDQNLKDLQAQRLAKYVSKGRVYPPKNDPKEVNPESKGPPRGLEPTPLEPVDVAQLPPDEGFDHE